MATSNDVRSAYLTANGSAFLGRVRIKGYQIKPSGTAGTITFYDGTSTSGINVINLDTTTSTQPIVVTVPGDGVLCLTGLYVAVAASHSVTVFYG